MAFVIVLAGLGAGSGTSDGAEGEADSNDGSVESVQARFSVFSDEAGDALDKTDLRGSFESEHAGLSVLSAETADTGDAAFAIKEAAKTAPAVSMAERLKLIFSPKAQ